MIVPPPAPITCQAWKPDWPAAQAQLERWWAGAGLAVALDAIRPAPREGIVPPAEPADLEARWLDPAYRCARAESYLARYDCRLAAFPYFDTHIGPGSLGLLLGAGAGFDRETVWYTPCIQDPELNEPLIFRPEGNRWLAAHLALIDEGLRRAEGRYLVGMPDLIEGLDTLAALRGDAALLYDLSDRPAWVLERLAELNQAYFAAFDLLYARIKDARGGNAFSAFRIWGPGKTAKLQCDISASLSPRMFRKFVRPFLEEQCRWLDYSLYHLDGTNALQHLDLLLEIPALKGIEWTPQAGRPEGGDPSWYELYRRMRAGGKLVQTVGVRPAEVLPLIETVGPAGLFILVKAPLPPAEADRLQRALEQYM